ncbi:MAG: ABC transporter ATP-binding protein [Candidatus Omnitrophica bacterium]|nr:ABC transporter ATP-binding protein [Candidatus Omnitrophota bacterium]
MNNVVEVSQLRIAYDEVMAVHDISFQLERGKIYGFVGPNGAGKTSTIKALAGVIEATQGSIVLNGFNLDLEREKALRHVGYMPDFSPVYENLKVWEYLDVFAAAYDIVAAERPAHVKKWLEKSDLVSKRDSLIKGLSRGMRQRLVLAKTLESNPNILLLDEPASGLDPIARKQMRDLIKEAANNGATVLISSHILSELSEFIDSAIILEKGDLVVAGSIDQIRTQTGGGQTITVRFSDENTGTDVLEKLLASEGIPLDRVSHNKGGYVIRFGNTGDDAVRFLNKVLTSGVRIAECSLKNDDIEDIFLKVGAKEVA